MNLKTSNYGTARTILGYTELTLWFGIAMGILVAIVGAGAAARGFGSPGLLAALPGIFLSAVSFIGVVLVQIGKATVDTADYSYQMLSVARDQLSVSQQALRREAKPTTYSNQLPREKPSSSGVSYETPSVLERRSETEQPALTQDQDGKGVAFHRNRRIRKTQHGYLYDGQTFETLDDAKLHIDDFYAS